jgi:hypothetical protein
MFDIYCSTCDRIYIVGTASLTAFGNTDDGALGRAACPVGHEVVVDFSASRARRPVTSDSILAA